MAHSRRQGASVVIDPGVQYAVQVCHERAHAAGNDPEDYALLSITEREIWWLLAGMILTASLVPCSKEDLIKLEQKMAGAIKAQRPDWRESHGLDD